MALALIRMWHANYAVRTLLTLHTVICKVALAKCHKSHPCSFLLLAEPHLPTDPISPPVFAFPWGNRQGVTRRRTRRDTDERVGGVEEEEDEGGGAERYEKTPGRMRLVNVWWVWAGIWDPVTPVVDSAVPTDQTRYQSASLLQAQHWRRALLGPCNTTVHRALLVSYRSNRNI